MSALTAKLQVVTQFESVKIAPFMMCGFPRSNFKFLPDRSMSVRSAMIFNSKVKYTIKKLPEDKYAVFQPGMSDPMDEPSEQALFGWLRNRGLSATEAVDLIEQVRSKGQATVDLLENLKLT
ncbi:MAG: hypothetical protein ACRD59_04485 [Candidatus Acidiferrales bacterium]